LHISKICLNYNMSCSYPIHMMLWRRNILKMNPHFYIERDPKYHQIFFPFWSRQDHVFRFKCTHLTNFFMPIFFFLITTRWLNSWGWIFKSIIVEHTEKQTNFKHVQIMEKFENKIHFQNTVTTHNLIKSFLKQNVVYANYFIHIP
jgi:hypothetical protein